MPYFPFFADICGKYVLIIGGGRRALAKVRRLLPFGAAIRVVYPELSPLLTQIPEIDAQIRRPNAADFQPVPLFVVAASEDNAENAEIARFCRSKNIPVNAVDHPDYCDFIFPALIARGTLSVGISTGGACPAVTTALRERIEAILPDATEEILVRLETLVPQLRQEIPTEKTRGIAIRALFAESVRLGRVLTIQEEQQILAPYLQPTGDNGNKS